MCAAVLSVRGKTHATTGNLNNHIGLPLTMLSMPQDALHGVFEVGINHPGEMAPLAAILQPQVAIITEIGAAHLGNFQSVEEIAREKSYLAQQVPKAGKIILNKNSEWVGTLLWHTCAGVRYVATEGVAGYSARIKGVGSLEVNGVDYKISLPGEHVMRNALQAIALGLELGMSPSEVAEGLRRFKLPPMRWEQSEVRGIHFINDAYNANPLSMQANLRTFAQLPGDGEKWVVVGGMRELGNRAEAEHAQLGRLIDELGFDGVIAVGKLGKLIICKGSAPFFQTLETASAAEILKEHLQPGDRVLLKASRGEHLEEVLNFFKNEELSINNE
jgi:UDP-N-acetylmuramoyl-tripeptide--D-alanyl-D-alanine ligase